MTTISKLGIQGIRSFDHERMEVIEFERPVTLIVGHNGSGKTTIIECLKMASAGLLPPNAKNGHGFIHDPQLAKLPEVKGQIRMLFRTSAASQHQEIAAIRSFQLTNRRVQGRIKPTYKALESVLRWTGEEGRPQSTSNRCLDMDNQVPQLMGVSRAVLENVIFCHQEDSSWPLQDAASVKKRFDDIFGATRYTLALKNIKDLQREWARSEKDRRADADLSQSHLEQANKLKGQKEEREKISTEITAELTDLASKMAAAGEDTQQAEVAMAQYDSCGVRIAELKSLMGRVMQDRQEVAGSMQERGQQVFLENLDVLQQQVKQFDEQLMVQAQQQLQQAKADVTKGHSDHQASWEAAQKLREDMGETAAAAELLSSRRVEMDKRLQQAQEPSVAALKAKLDTEASELARIEREHRQNDTGLEQAIASTDRLFQEASLEASTKESRAADAQKAIGRLEDEAKTLARASPDLDALIRAMQKNEADLGAEGNDTRLRSLQSRQEEISRRRHELQYNVQRKNSEVCTLEAQSGVHAEVDSLRARLREAEQELAAKLGELRAGLVPLLGQMPEAAETESKTIAELQLAQQQLGAQGQKSQELQNRAGAAAARRGSWEVDLKRLQQQEAQVAAELGIPSALEGGDATSAMADFNSTLAHKKNEVELARKDLAMTESAKHMYDKFRERSRQKNACQFCKRTFQNENDIAGFEDSVDKLVGKIPDFLERSQHRLSEMQAEVNRLEALRPRWQVLLQLRSEEIPRRQREAAAALDDERAARAALEPEDRERKRLEERVRQLQELRPEAAAVQWRARVVEELRVTVRSKEARLLGANSKVSLQAERDQLRALQEQLTELGREEDAVRTQRDILAKQQEGLRTQLAEQKGRLQMLKAQVARRSDVDSELADRKSELLECSGTAKTARASADAASARAKQLREERAMSVAQYRHSHDSRDSRVRGLQREVDALSELEKAIEVMTGRVQNADALKAKLTVADNAVRTAERELEGCRARVEAAEERKNKRAAVRESLQANIRLKNLEAESQRHQAEIDALLKDLGGKDIDALRRDVEAARARALAFYKQHSFREGELAQTKAQLTALETELRGPLYMTVEQRHREAVIRHESAALTVKDLGRYHMALDKALMKFHTLKMAEINKTIKELWQKVYRGRDIDYVAIRSDSEEGTEEGGGPADSAAAGRALRSYNYRVVMVCGSAEMDMRGRCSAGQRVLSSLIIRLALADSFCVNCGVLALDEPTTNLDADNIRGLAEALAGLIEARRAHDRFQLILITHDEAFVSHLTQLQVADWYYHIRKDERGCSKIEKKQLHLLQN